MRPISAYPEQSPFPAELPSIIRHALRADALTPNDAAALTCALTETTDQLDALEAKLYNVQQLMSLCVDLTGRRVNQVIEINAEAFIATTALFADELTMALSSVKTVQRLIGQLHESV